MMVLYSMEVRCNCLVLPKPPLVLGMEGSLVCGPVQLLKGSVVLISSTLLKRLATQQALEEDTMCCSA